MAEVDDEEPAPPADVEITQPGSAPSGDADTAMDEEPAAPMDVPMASSDTAAAMETEAAASSGLDAQLVQAAQAAGIDMAFLEALPEDLRAEVSSLVGSTAAACIASFSHCLNTQALKHIHCQDTLPCAPQLGRDRVYLTVHIWHWAFYWLVERRFSHFIGTAGLGCTRGHIASSTTSSCGTCSTTYYRSC